MLIYAIACTFALGMLFGIQITFFGAYLKDKRDEKVTQDTNEFTPDILDYSKPPFNLINPESVS